MIRTASILVVSALVVMPLTASHAKAISSAPGTSVEVYGEDTVGKGVHCDYYYPMPREVCSICFDTTVRPWRQIFNNCDPAQDLEETKLQLNSNTTE